MPLFSERYGFKKPKPMLGLQEVDDALKAGLWDVCLNHFFYVYVSEWEGDKTSENNHIFSNARKIWHYIFKRPSDEIPETASEIVGEVREYFFECDFVGLYDFIEFMAKYGDPDFNCTNSEFVKSCNAVLEREKSPYRFSGVDLVPITNEMELEEITKAQEVPLSASAKHINNAVKAYGDRGSPNYRQAVAEAIHAVEAIAREVIGDQSAVLSQAVKELRRRQMIHPALADAIVKLYSWASDTARHAEKGEIYEPEARQALVVCSALVNYLTTKKRR